MAFSLIYIYFSIFVLVNVTKVFCRPISKSCNKDIDTKYAAELLKGLQENKFRILDILDIKTVKPMEPFEDLTIALAQKILDKKKKKAVCPIVYEKNIDNYRFPKEIVYAKLINRKDLTHCRPIRRTVTYFERKKKCNEKLQQHLYSLRKMKVVVAYEAMMAP